MERLTVKLPDGRIILKEHYNEVFSREHGFFIEGDAVNKLAEYEDAEERGELVKVVRGEWMTFDDRMGNAIGVCCSVCGNRSVIGKHLLLGNAEVVFNNFCPRCGADMRKGTSHE